MTFSNFSNHFARPYAVLFLLIKQARDFICQTLVTTKEQYTNEKNLIDRGLKILLTSRLVIKGH